MTEEQLGTVYLIKCLINSKGYYGQTMLDNPQDRIRNHVAAARRGSNYTLHRAIRKHGWDNFIVCWLHYKSLPKHKCDSYEAFYILANDAMNPKKGYNMTSGGEGSIPNEVVREKKRIAQTGKKYPEESRKRMSESRKGKIPWNKGIPWPEEIKIKIGEANKGREAPNKGIPHEQETKDKISKANKGKIPWSKGKRLTDEHKHNISVSVRETIANNKDEELEEMGQTSFL